MNTTHNLTRIIAGALLSGGLAVPGLALATGTAQASCSYGICSHQWCPGQPMVQGWVIGPDGVERRVNDVVWDMSVCHQWFHAADDRYGGAQVGSRIREGDPSPPPIPLWVP
jgi:hypothetical protein